MYIICHYSILKIPHLFPFAAFLSDGATEDTTNAGKDENEAPIENNGNEKANEANKHIEPDRYVKIRPFSTYSTYTCRY